MFVPKAELVRRLNDRFGKIANPRPDDHPDAIPRRIQTYLDETRPVVNYYQAQGLLRRIDGVGPIGEVFERILEAIDSVVLTPPGT
jgi:adenylate kinase